MVMMKTLMNLSMQIMGCRYFAEEEEEEEEDDDVDDCKDVGDDDDEDRDANYGLPVLCGGRREQKNQ